MSTVDALFAVTLSKLLNKLLVINTFLGIDVSRYAQCEIYAAQYDITVTS